MATLQEYRAFVAIVDTGSVSKAAERLYRTASAVSKQLSKLESDLGVQLVDRTTQSVVVTRRGEEFYRRCKMILASVEEAEAAVKEDLESPAGRISISVGEGLVNSRLMSLLGEFSETYPDIRFNVSVSNQLEDLLENQIDFAFRVSRANDERLVSHDLTHIKMIAVASPDYLKRVNLPATMRGLIEGGHVIVPLEVNVPRAVSELAPDLSRDAIDLTIAHTVNSFGGVVALAAAGLGVAITNDFSVQTELDEGTLVNLFPDRTFLDSDVRLVYRRREFMPKAMELFRDFIREKYAEEEAAHAPAAGPEN